MALSSYTKSNAPVLVSTERLLRCTSSLILMLGEFRTGEVDDFVDLLRWICA